MSPRRSSRARASANQPPLAHHSSSSSSSSSSSRGSAIRHHKNHDDPIDHDPSFRDLPSFTDSRNGNNAANVGLNELETADDDLDETGSQEEEITRCICGHQEYQGEDDQTDTSEGLFILCDKCHVWQHGFCVGITDKAMTPENYFCEKCRPDLHKLVVKPHGPKSSIYLPVHAETSPTEPHGPKDMPTKRRSTMNSRDAAYDNAFDLQRAIEESKSEQLKATRGSTRGRKRGTSEGSEEQKDYKRAKTADSDSHTTVTADSSDEKDEKNANSNKKGRNASVRATSVNSTKRPIRNRAAEKGKEAKKEDLEIADEYPARANGRASKATVTTSTPTEEVNTILAPETQTPDTPQQNSKRNGRAANGAGGGRKRGSNNRNNSYRQSEDPHEEAIISPHILARNPSQSAHDKTQSAIDSTSASTGNSSEKPAKSRLAHKTSLTEMNKRINSIMEFIQRTQLEMAYEKQRLFHVRGHNSPKPQGSHTNNEVNSPIPQITINGTSNKAEEKSTTAAKIHSTEMMDILTRKLVHWQQTYGKMAKV